MSGIVKSSMLPPLVKLFDAKHLKTIHIDKIIAWATSFAPWRYISFLLLNLACRQRIKPLPACLVAICSVLVARAGNAEPGMQASQAPERKKRKTP